MVQQLVESQATAGRTRQTKSAAITIGSAPSPPPWSARDGSPVRRRRSRSGSRKRWVRHRSRSQKLGRRTGEMHLALSPPLRPIRLRPRAVLEGRSEGTQLGSRGVGAARLPVSRRGCSSKLRSRRATRTNPAAVRGSTSSRPHRLVTARDALLDRIRSAPRFEGSSAPRFACTATTTSRAVLWAEGGLLPARLRGRTGAFPAVRAGETRSLR